MRHDPIDPAAFRAVAYEASIPLELRVVDVMANAPVTIRDDALALAAWELMRSRGVRHLPVVDAGGALVGILSDRDLRQVIVDPEIHVQLCNVPAALGTLTVDRVMTWGAITVTPDTHLRDAAVLMKERRIDALPVVADGCVVGILTAADLITALVNRMGVGSQR